jgi:hypothetical protein
MLTKLEFLEKVFGKGQYSHNTHELGIRCPFCFHHKNKLFVNLDKDAWHCFPCGKAGVGLQSLIKKAGTSQDLKTYLSKFKTKNVSTPSADSAEIKKFVLEFPKQYRPLIHNMNTITGTRTLKYLSSRGITQDDILFYKIGIAFEGQLQDRVIFPSFDADGNLNYYTTRLIEDRPMKYWSPSVPHDYKMEQIFNELYVDWSQPVVLVEGFVDSIKAPNSIPLFGSHLDVRYKTFQVVVRSGLPVYLAFDSDAFSKTNRVAELFMSYDVDVYVVDVSPFSDVGEMSREQFLEKKKNATPFSQELVFRNKLRMLK